MSIADVPIPRTALTHRVHAYVKELLPSPAYNHCLRVYHFGLAIKQYRFPEWEFTDETYYLACLLHDIGTTNESTFHTRLSFEFYGVLVALRVLQSSDILSSAPIEQAESVAEAIMRHQYLCDEGKITALGQLLQLATFFGTLKSNCRVSLHANG